MAAPVVPGSAVLPQTKLQITTSMSSTTPSLLPIPDNIEALAGPLLIGYILNWGLFGALSVQVFLYYPSFPKDRIGIKCLVFGLYVLEILQTVIITHDMFQGYAAGFGNLSALGNEHLEWLGVPVLDGIVSGIVQIFFAFRISVLSNNKLIGIGITAIALLQASAAITQGIQAFLVTDFNQLQVKAFISCTIWLAGSAFCDIIIAGCMSYFLLRRDTGFKPTQILLNKLVRLTIETGSLTAVIATVDIILFVAFPRNNYHTTPALTLGKLYSNTLLLILNSRIRVIGGRDMTVTTELMELNTAISRPAPGHFRGFDASKKAPVTNITVHKDTWTDQVQTDDITADGSKITYLGQNEHKGAMLGLSREGI